MQISTTPPPLSALLEHPDFQQGVEWGREAYYDLEYEAILTETEMIELVEDELSQRSRKQALQWSQFMGREPIPYLTCLGVVLGAIDEALSQAKQE